MDDWLSQKARSAEAAVDGGFDLTVCVREPIHLLGGIQSYGTLLAVDPATGRVSAAAGNTGTVLGQEADALLGRPVTDVLSTEDWDELRAAAGEDQASAVALRVVTGGGAGGTFDVTAHRGGDGLLLVEFEPQRDDGIADARFYQRVGHALARLRGARTVRECCQAAVAEVSALTGFDRVVAYRFDGHDGPGEVVSEQVADGWEPWLGLWFPATDIPPQARRLYEENWIRVIADVDDPTVRLRPALIEGGERPLDLSQAVLRTVSEFHLEYLRNIGVRSSMSVSLLREGRLWGLIACHGARPAPLPAAVRSACELFGSAFSMQLAAIEERERADALEQAVRDAGEIAELLDADTGSSIMRNERALRDLLDADGLVLVRGGRVLSAGLAVSRALAASLVRCAREGDREESWSTDRLPEVLAERGEDPASADGVAGVLLVPLGGDGDCLAWVRGERPMPRQWAADPARPVLVGPRGERLTPRGSGAVFRSTMRGRSTPWTAKDEAGAVEMRRLLTGLVLRHADALSRLNAELRRTNLDLDSFAHVTAHDLKEPLRGIANTATFVLEDAGEALDGTSVRRLETIRRLAARMDDLLNSLLHYSRMGRAGLRRDHLDLDEVLDAALEVAGPRLAENGVAVVRPPALPRIWADRERLYEILVNLLVNAAKYADDRRDRRVQIAMEDAVPPGSDSAVTALVVRDNGIGIPGERQAEVFELFRRLHGPGEHGGGTGVGLAVVKRIVDQHDGLLWLLSEPGSGSAFYLTLGPAGPASAAPAARDTSDAPDTPDVPGSSAAEG
ncbi:ATP-binding protein [Streptomyces sp. NPDC090106]|uniref:ATP-binding protein n=1 Tax=Streptomyces sp. NPDC090106 TaxID=3365946 RepID=UPI0038289517